MWLQIATETTTTADQRTEMMKYRQIPITNNHFMSSENDESHCVGSCSVAVKQVPIKEMTQR